MAEQSSEIVQRVSAELYRVLHIYMDDAEFADEKLDYCINLRDICEVLAWRVVEDVEAEAETSASG